MINLIVQHLKCHVAMLTDGRQYSAVVSSLGSGRKPLRLESHVTPPLSWKVYYASVPCFSHLQNGEILVLIAWEGFSKMMSVRHLAPRPHAVRSQ